jgi:hypothetical protein
MRYKSDLSHGLTEGACQSDAKTDIAPPRADDNVVGVFFDMSAAKTCARKLSTGTDNESVSVERV